jgi:hypothetical protein
LFKFENGSNKKCSKNLDKTKKRKTERNQKETSGAQKKEKINEKRPPRTF